MRLRSLRRRAVRLCVDAGASPDAQKDLGQGNGGMQSLLMVALASRANKAMKALLECGAKTDVRDSKLMTPLLHAATWGDTEALKILLAGGASPHLADNLLNTALHAAAMLDKPACVKALIPVSDLSVRNKIGRTAFHIAACGEACLSLLLPHVQDVDFPTSAGIDHNGTPSVGGITALMLASSFGRLNNVKALLAAGADRAACDSTYGTALQRAASAGHLLVLRKLLGPLEKPEMSVAEIGVENASGASPLICAVAEGHIDVASVLLEYGAVCTPTVLRIAQQRQPNNQRLMAALLAGAAGVAQGCHRCGETAGADGKLLYCGGCRSLRFCSAKCMAEAWPEHKADCKRLQKQSERLRAPHAM